MYQTRIIIKIFHNFQDATEGLDDVVQNSVRKWDYPEGYDVTMIDPTKVYDDPHFNLADYFESLDVGTQTILMECALQALRDEMNDGFMREGHMLEDVAEWVIEEIHNNLDNFLNKEV